MSSAHVSFHRQTCASFKIASQKHTNAKRLISFDELPETELIFDFEIETLQSALHWFVYHFLATICAAFARTNTLPGIGGFFIFLTFFFFQNAQSVSCFLVSSISAIRFYSLLSVTYLSWYEYGNANSALET